MSGKLNIVCGHRAEGVSLVAEIPACEGVAFLGGSCGSFCLSTVGVNPALNCGAAVGIEAHGVFVNSPVSNKGNIICGHGAEDVSLIAEIPAGEGVTGLGGLCGSLGLGAEIIDPALNIGAAVGIEAHGVLVNSPLCGDDKAAVGSYRHLCGNLGIPTCEGVACLGGIVGSRDIGVVILVDLLINSAVGILKYNRIGVCSPSRLKDKGLVLGGDVGHRCGDGICGIGACHIPAGEGVARSDGICGSGDACAVDAGDILDCRVTGVGELDGVGVLSPLRYDVGVPCGHGFGLT